MRDISHYWSQLLFHNWFSCKSLVWKPWSALGTISSGERPRLNYRKRINQRQIKSKRVKPSSRSKPEIRHSVAQRLRAQFGASDQRGFEFQLHPLLTLRLWTRSHLFSLCLRSAQPWNRDDSSTCPMKLFWELNWRICVKPRRVPGSKD